MVNVEMFRNAFVPPKPAAQSQPVPIAQPPPVTPDDPEVAKLKFFMLKWLSIIIGGSAVLLIVWRIALKFI